MTDFTIEPGKFYKTRGGYMVCVYHVYEGKEIHGAVYDKDYDEWRVKSWFLGGRYTSGRIESLLDIVGVWSDPPVVDWDRFPKHIVAIAISGDGLWRGYMTIPERAYLSWHTSNDPYFGVFFLLTEDIPNFNGDWRDSLVVRPGYEEKENA